MGLQHVLYKKAALISEIPIWSTTPDIFAHCQMAFAVRLDDSNLVLAHEKALSLRVCCVYKPQAKYGLYYR